MELDWARANGRRAFAIFLAVSVAVAGFPLVLWGTVLVAEQAGSDWSVIAGFGAFFVLLGLLGSVVLRLLEWGRNGMYRTLFPGYAGKKFPAFVLLDGPDSWKKFQSDDTMMWLAEAPDCFFALRTREPKKGRHPSGERLLHVGRQPLAIQKSDIQVVEVIDRSDAEIADSASDRRDYVDRIGSAVAQRLTGISVRTRIVPFAAYVVVITPTFSLVFGVPTEVPSVVLDKLSGTITARSISDDPIVGSGVGMVRQQITNAATSEIAATDVGAVVTSGAAKVMDLMGSAQWWLNPDAADIATARGERGRLAAHLLAEALRAHQTTPSAKAA